MTDHKYQIGPSTFNYKLMALSYHGQSVKLSSQVCDLLLLFINSPEQIVEREVAIKELWNGNEGVGKKAFTNTIWLIRKIFRDLNIDEEVFETLPKLGYKLNFKVTNVTSLINRKPLMIFSITIAAIALLISYFFINQNLPKDDFTNDLNSNSLEPSKVTYLEGVEEHIAVSHSGTRLAMQWQTNQLDGKIYLKNLENQDAPLELLSLTTDKEASPAWSASDNKLAYVRITDENVCEVRVREFDTNKDYLVASDCFYIPFWRVLTWSDTDDNELIYAKQFKDYVALVSYSLETKQSKIITQPKKNEINFAPKFFSQTSQFAFIRANNGINTLSLILRNENGTEKEIISHSRSIVDFDYSAKKKMFYVSMQENGNSIIARFDHLLNELPPIKNLGLLSSIVVSDVNDKLYVTKHISKEYIIQQSYTGNVLRKISSSSRDMYANLSPISNNILFLSNRSSFWSVWKNDGVSSKNLTKDLGSVGIPAISPTSTNYAVNINIENVNKLYIGDIKSERLRQVDVNGIESEFVTWSRDGAYLYFIEINKTKKAIYRLSVSSSEIQKVSNVNAEFIVVGESDSILYMSRYNEDGIWKLNLENQELSLVTSKLLGDDFGAFYYENNHLYYVERTKTQDLVKKISINDINTSETITSFPANSIRRFVGLAGADETSFLLTLKVANEADVLAFDL